MHFLVRCQWNKSCGVSKCAIVFTDTTSKLHRFDERNGRNMNPKVLTLIAHLCWLVWKECNQCIFKNQKPNPVQVLNSVFAANGKFLDVVY